MPTYPLEWDKVGEHLYETGTDRGVVYPYNATNKQYDAGVAWNGLTGFTDNPSGADETKLWADNIKYVSMRAAEEYGGTITAYTYPDEFAECDGSAFADSSKIVNIGQQKRKSFGFSCRTLVGNDTDLNDHGYKIHLVYGASVSPSSKDFKTVNDSPDAIEFSWEFTTTPENVGTAYKPTSHIVIDASKIEAGSTEAGYLTTLENILYGTSTAQYVKMTQATQPQDWPTTSTQSTKYFKNTGTASAPVYEGVTSSDTYAANTYFQKYEPAPARLPSPAEVIELFGGNANSVG